MPKTSPRLVLDTLRALIAGRQIRGDLPSYTDLEAATGAARMTVAAAVGDLGDEGYVTKHDNGRGHTITPPSRVLNPAVNRLVDELERAAVATNVAFEDVVALLASRMLVRGDWSDKRSEQLALIRSTVETYRRFDRRAPAKSSTRAPSKRERAEAALEELEGDHPSWQ